MIVTTTNKERAAMELALEALEKIAYDTANPDTEKAITALREALDHSGEAHEMVQDMNLNCKSVQARLATSWGYVKAEQAEQEPVIRATLAPPAPPEVYQMRSKDAYEAGWWEAQRQKAVSPIAPVKQAEQDHFADSGKPIAEQGPVACIIHTKEGDYVDWNSKGYCFYTGETPLYAAPVRTKDLTDDEISDAIHGKFSPLRLHDYAIRDFRAVIAADREKNK